MLNNYARAKMGLYLYSIAFIVAFTLLIFSIINKDAFKDLYKASTELDFSFTSLFKPQTYKEMKLTMPKLDGFSAKFIYPYIGLIGILIVVEVILLIIAVFSAITALRLGLIIPLFILIGIVVPGLMFVGFLFLARKTRAEILGIPYKKPKGVPQNNQEGYY